MSITPTEILAVIGIVTAIFHAAMYIGRLSVRITLHEGRLAEHAGRLDDHDKELRFLKGIQ